MSSLYVLKYLIWFQKCRKLKALLVTKIYPMKTLSICCLLLFFFPISLSAQAPLQLEEAIAIGLENNYSIKLAKQGEVLAANDVTRGNAGFLPLVNASFTQTNSIQNINQVFITGNENKQNGATASSWTLGAQVNWTVFDGLKMFITYEKLEELRMVGEIQARLAIENTVASIANAYYEVVQQYQRIVVLEENLALSAARSQLADEQFQLGAVAKRDWLLAQVDENADRSALQSQQALLAQSKTLLNRLMGRAPETEYEVNVDIDLLDLLSLESLQTDALAQNPSLALARQQMLVATSTIDELKASRWPTVSLNAGYNYTRAQSAAGFLLSNQVNGFNAGISANMNLFNGLNLQRQIQNAEIERETQRLTIEDLQQQVVTDLHFIYLSYTSNLELLKLEGKSLEVSRQTLAITRQTYEEGELSAIEFRDAQKNHVEAENRLINARYRVKLDEIELQRLSGTLKF